MPAKATISQKANQLLAKLGPNPDQVIDEKFKQGYFKASEGFLQDMEIRMVSKSE